MEEVERKVLNINGVKILSSAVRISGSDIVNEGIIQGSYKEKVYKFVSSKIVGAPQEELDYYYFERDAFISNSYSRDSDDMYWTLREQSRLDIIVYSVRYNTALYIKIVGKLPAITVDDDVVISRGYSHFFGLLKKEDEVKHVQVGVADLSLVHGIYDIIKQRFYEEKMLDFN